MSHLAAILGKLLDLAIAAACVWVVYTLAAAHPHTAVIAGVLAIPLTIYILVASRRT